MNIHRTDDELTTIVRREVADYASLSPNSTAYFLADPAQQVYGVVVVPFDHTRTSLVMVLARIDSGKVIIDADNTNKPLYEAFVHAGIPEQQIVLA